MEGKKTLTIVLGVLLVLCIILIIYLYAVPYKQASNKLQEAQAQVIELRTEVEQSKVSQEEPGVGGAVVPEKRLIGTLYFNSGDAQLTTSGLATLGEIEEVLKSNTDKVVVIEGHADNVPLGQFARTRFNSNLELSAARALRVARYCKQKMGIQPDRITVAAFSEYRPIAGNESKEERRKNRRVEIYLQAVN